MANTQADNKGSYDDDAKKLGATHRRLFYVRVGSFPWGDAKMELFSTHYFNAEDKEICYTIEDMKSVCGMTVLEQPREWGEKCKNDCTLVNYV